jgi:hypothetical protein
MHTRTAAALKKCLIATLLATSSLLAHAGSVDNGVATPSSILINNEVDFALSLTGPLKACHVELRWGDGGGIADAVVTSADLPIKHFTHKYLTAGQFTITANALSGCTGAVRAVVNVIGPRVNTKPTTAPAPLGKLSGMTLVGTLNTGVPNVFRVGDTLQATAQGVNGAACGMSFVSDATVTAVPTFVVVAVTPFPVARAIQKLIAGAHTVRAIPVVVGNTPACDGAAIITPITVM